MVEPSLRNKHGWILHAPPGMRRNGALPHARHPRGEEGGGGCDLQAVVVECDAGAPQCMIVSIT